MRFTYFSYLTELKMTRTSESFLGTERFELRRRLGAGGMGVVYEAFDRDRGRIVALKTLLRASADDLYRFKREFRALADVAHPNLVSLYELMSDGSHWFFTMELVPGVNFLDYVRDEAAAESAEHELPTLRASFDTDSDLHSPSPDAPTRATHTRAQLDEDAAPQSTRVASVCNVPRLRAALRQLAAGVNALHETDQLHLDIKPSNVLVTPEGRVVLLDFGLILETSAPELRQQRGLAGTPAYMSPEQIASRRITRATDWYSVGVILYEALTGRLPFSGTVLDVLERKQEAEPPPPATLVPGLPADLDALCRDLLRRDPTARPTGREVFERLSGATTQAGVAATTELPVAPAELFGGTDPEELFIGRAPQLAALDGAYQTVKQGQSLSVYVHGMSGMGKSALVARFLAELQRRDHEAVVLKGRCYEREFVPYKALDGVVDSLSKHLLSLPADQVDELMPVDAPALARLFPVILQVGAIRDVPQREQLLADPLVLRRRAFAALRELLARLALRQPLVVFIDDLHWADADSTALLEDLLRPPDAPPLLLVASFRSEEIETKPFLRQLLKRASSTHAREIRLQPLPTAEARELVLSLLPAERNGLEASIETIVQEADGNPLFIEELTRYALASGGARAHLSLGQMIIARLESQPAGARALLETLTVAGRPMRPDVTAQATGIAGDEARLIASLRAARFLRSGGTTQQLELYHDRIRETLAAGLDEEAVRQIHRRLAETLTAKGVDDPELLFEHILGAGETELAATLASLAARRAVAALAFDRAAHFYRKAIELAPVVGTDLAQLKINLGEALANAGRPAEAAEIYLDTARTAQPDQALELQRRAAEQLLMGGHINEGLDVLRRVLAAVGFRLAPDPPRALLSLLRQRALLRMRGLKFTPRAADEIPKEDLVRIDTCWAVAAGLGLVDTIRAFDFQTRHLLLALRAGELYRIARAFCCEVGFIATAGGPVAQNTAHLLEQAEALAHRSGHPHAQALAVWARGLSAYLCGDWSNAAKLCARAADLLREKCTGVTWELTTANRFLLSSLLFLGDIGELTRRVPVLLAAAEEQGNLLAATDLRTRLNLVWLAQDQPDVARQEIIDAMLRWPQEGFHLQHYSALLALVQIEMYTGDGAVAWKHLVGQWRALTRSMLMRVQVLRIEARHLRARSALAAAVSGVAAPARLLQTATELVRLNEREQMTWARPLNALVRAGVAGLGDDHARAAELCAVALAGFEAAQMHLYAAAARRRLGQLVGGAEGRQLVAQADAWMTEQRIKRPDRMTDMLAPGFFYITGTESPMP